MNTRAQSPLEFYSFLSLSPNMWGANLVSSMNLVLYCKTVLLPYTFSCYMLEVLYYYWILFYGISHPLSLRGYLMIPIALGLWCKLSGSSHQILNGVPSSSHWRLNGVSSPSHRGLNDVFNPFHRGSNGVTVIYIGLDIRLYFLLCSTWLYIYIFLFLLCFVLDHSHVSIFNHFDLVYVLPLLYV